MVDDARMDRLENTVLEIHRVVIRIENEHGMKIEALFDALDSIHRAQEATNRAQEATNRAQEATNRAQEATNQRLSRIEASIADIQNQMKGLKVLVETLQSIAKDHEERLLKAGL